MEITDLTGDGDCYPTAYAQAHQMIADYTNVRIVHGLPVAQHGPAKGSRIHHAWVEYDLAVPISSTHKFDLDQTMTVRCARDYSNGTHVDTSAAFYRQLGDIDSAPVAEYPVDQAILLATSFGHYGPWDGSTPPIP